MRYRIDAVIPSSRFELILVSPLPGPGRATGSGRS